MSFLSWFYLLLLSFIWGASFYFIEVGLVYLSPAWLVCLRLTSAAIFFWLCVLARDVPAPFSPFFGGAALVMGIINNLLPFFLIAWGQLFVTGGMASIINANTAFFGVIISAIFLRSEPLRLHRVIGVFLGILGVATVIGFDAAHGLCLDNRVTGHFTGNLFLCASRSMGQVKAQQLASHAGSLWDADLFGQPVSSGQLFDFWYALIQPFQPANMLVLPQLVIGIGILGTALAYRFIFGY